MKHSVLLLFLLVAAAAVLPGCGTPGTAAFPAPAAGGKTATGQLQYRSGTGRSVIGDVVLRRSPDGRDVQLAFSSGAGFPLLRLALSGARLRAEGPLARGSWEGDAARAPKHLQGWAGATQMLARTGLGNKARFEDASGSGDVFTFVFAE
jgi:hypothetical protein